MGRDQGDYLVDLFKGKEFTYKIVKDIAQVRLGSPCRAEAG